MKSIWNALNAETLKVRRSLMFWVILVVFIFIIAMVGLTIFLMKNPELSHKFGLIGTKAAMLRFGTLDWAAYMDLLDQLVAGLGMVGFGFITAWVFGREYSDHTLKDLLALPVSRSSIVLSKFIVIGIWSAFLMVIIFMSGLVIGLLIHIPGLSRNVMIDKAYAFFITCLLTLVLCPPAAFLANVGKGFLAPIGFIFLMLIMAQLVGSVNLSPYFPWAIPLVYGTGGPEKNALTAVSYIILFITGITGFIMTFAWWEYADHI